MPRLCLVLLCLSLLACAGDGVRAPVEERRGEPKPERAPPSGHRVVTGDTLYGIAWRYGLDYRQLARANRIPRPYQIYPGQELQLDEESVPVVRTTKRAEKSVAKKTEKRTAKTAVQPAPASPVTRPSSTAAKTTKKAKDLSVSNTPVSHWRWPAQGKVVRGFSGTVHKGIDIAGQAGDPVLATSAGRVVYAGSAIVGYGNLLIVKHNEVYLSAYGHNRRLLVKEGDLVKSGERIAEKGSSATNTVKLHFEIRREGKPIDPKKLLPAS
jgi:lipoprotein NlpD